MADERGGERPADDLRAAELLVVDDDVRIVPVDEVVPQDGQKGDEGGEEDDPDSQQVPPPRISPPRRTRRTRRINVVQDLPPCPPCPLWWRFRSREPATLRRLARGLVATSLRRERVGGHEVTERRPRAVRLQLEPATRRLDRLVVAPRVEIELRQEQVAFGEARVAGDRGDVRS